MSRVDRDKRGETGEHKPWWWNEPESKDAARRKFQEMVSALDRVGRGRYQVAVQTPDQLWPLSIQVTVPDTPPLPLAVPRYSATRPLDAPDGSTRRRTTRAPFSVTSMKAWAPLDQSALKWWPASSQTQVPQMGVAPAPPSHWWRA